MTDKTSLGDRMKQYEATTQLSLLRRTPVIIRVDGRAFHSYVPRFFNKETDPSLTITPFSESMHHAMLGTMMSLMFTIQNSVFAYTQSDEISVLLRDWDNHETQQWFGGNIQKIVSVSASASTAAFNFGAQTWAQVKHQCFQDLAQFDARVYNLPQEEVVNYFIWRQQDASRNSVQQLARFYYSHKQLHGKSNSQIQDMLMLEKGVNWNNLPTWMKRGSCAYQDPEWCNFLSSPRCKHDNEPPIFTQDRDYVAKHLRPKEEENGNA